MFAINLTVSDDIFAFLVELSNSNPLVTLIGQLKHLIANSLMVVRSLSRWIRTIVGTMNTLKIIITSLISITKIKVVVVMEKSKTTIITIRETIIIKKEGAMTSSEGVWLTTLTMITTMIEITVEIMVSIITRIEAVLDLEHHLGKVVGEEVMVGMMTIRITQMGYIEMIAMEVVMVVAVLVEALDFRFKSEVKWKSRKRITIPANSECIDKSLSRICPSQ